MAVNVNNGTSLGSVVVLPLKGEKGDGVTQMQAELDALEQRVEQIIAPAGEAPNPTEIIDARIGADGVSYTSLGIADRTQFENLKKTKYDAKVIDSEEWYKSDIAFEQGSVTSSGESASEYDIRTGYIEEGFYISNPNGAFSFVILEYDESKTFKRYINASVPSEGGGLYKDELFYVPPAYNGYHRVRVKRYINGTQAIINPNSQRSLDLYFSANKYENSIAFEQGSITSSGESASDRDIRTGYIDDGFYIRNPNGDFAFCLLSYDGNKTFRGYKSANSPVDGATNFYNDKLFFVPSIHNGYYRVRVRKIVDGTAQIIDPSMSTLRACYFNENRVNYSLGTLLSSGFARSTNEVVSSPISLSCGHNSFSVKLKNPNYRVAVYETDNSVNWHPIFSGWLPSKTRHVLYDSSQPKRVYAFRIATSSGSVTFNYDDAVNAIEFNLYDDTHGYSRDYDDITPQITLEHKSISSSGIVDSNNDLLGKLPNNGNVEVKLNAPMGKFAIYKDTNGEITQLTDGWTHYQYRYTGDYVSDYYVRIQYEGGNPISIPAGYQIIRAYLYNDFGKSYPIATKLQHKNIAFFGDSIVQGRFCKNGETVNLCMAKPYSVLISEIIGDESPMNYGIGGGLVYDSDWKSMYRNVGNVVGYDTVFFCAGTNDYGGNIPSADFTDAYRYVINTLVSNNTEVIVCTPTMRRNMDANGANMTLQDYADIEKSIANEKGLGIIDLLSLTNYNNPFYHALTDGLHPNEIGHGIIADIILREYEIL